MEAFDLNKPLKQIISFKHTKRDIELFLYLQDKEEKSDYIKELIYRDMKKQKYKK